MTGPAWLIDQNGVIRLLTTVVDDAESQRIKKPFGGEQVRGLNVEEAGEAASGWVTLSSECILRSTLTHPCRRALGDRLLMHGTCQICRFFVASRRSVKTGPIDAKASRTTRWRSIVQRRNRRTLETSALNTYRSPTWSAPSRVEMGGLRKLFREAVVLK